MARTGTQLRELYLRGNGIEDSREVLHLQVTCCCARLLPADPLPQDLMHLTVLSLVANPCAGFAHYRGYVIAALPGLKVLDDVEVCVPACGCPTHHRSR